MVESDVIDPEPLITHERPLEELEDALQMVMRGECIKTAIVPE